MGNELSRRRFLGGSIAVGLGVTSPAASAAVSNRIQGANDRLRLGFIGVGNRGTQLLRAFQTFEQVETVALCDVYEPYLYRDPSGIDPELAAELGGRIPKMNEELGKSVARYKDYRELLDRRDIDAVVISTPDHWHALQTIESCQSGKDVYCEKPLSMTIREGRRMTDVARETGRIVQVGLQRRSSDVYRRLAVEVKKGVVGPISMARAYRVSNMSPTGIGRKKRREPPSNFDWNFWLGPRAWRPYQDNIHPYRFRWWKDYSSQVGNWGVHYFDAMRWMMGEEAPRFVTAHGSKLFVDDDRTIPDTMEVTFQFPSGSLMTFGQYEASGGHALIHGEIELRGTRGNLYTDSSGYMVVPSEGGQFQDPAVRMEKIEVEGERADPTIAHVGDFLNALRTRKPASCPLEQGHRSTVFALLANIAWETGARLEWDSSQEKILSPVEANELLHYKYREPWNLS